MSFCCTPTGVPTESSHILLVCRNVCELTWPMPGLSAALPRLFHLCGGDHVGIGSDGVIQKMAFRPEQKAAFDQDVARRKRAGMGPPGEDRFPFLPDRTGPDHMQVIARELTKRGQPASVVEKVLGANFRRVIGEIWGQVRACSSRHHILREAVFCELRGAS